MDRSEHNKNGTKTGTDQNIIENGTETWTDHNITENGTYACKGQIIIETWTDKNRTQNKWFRNMDRSDQSKNVDIHI